MALVLTMLADAAAVDAVGSADAAATGQLTGTGPECRPRQHRLSAVQLAVLRAYE
ncbi:hypothetical protein ABN028_01055 [Actinopolymorpha sp. B17G11]|uniref:hypothetical protein n=1 Tax=unclassified Actinopolymorpha TaxID=2627063 RepID=UPI0032D8B706